MITISNISEPESSFRKLINEKRLKLASYTLPVDYKGNECGSLHTLHWSMCLDSSLEIISLQDREICNIKICLISYSDILNRLFKMPKKRGSKLCLDRVYQPAGSVLPSAHAWTAGQLGFPSPFGLGVWMRLGFRLSACFPTGLFLPVFLVELILLASNKLGCDLVKDKIEPRFSI